MKSFCAKNPMPGLPVVKVVSVNWPSCVQVPRTAPLDEGREYTCICYRTTELVTRGRHATWNEAPRENLEAAERASPLHDLEVDPRIALLLTIL